MFSEAPGSGLWDLRKEAQSPEKQSAAKPWFPHFCSILPVCTQHGVSVLPPPTTLIRENSRGACDARGFLAPTNNTYKHIQHIPHIPSDDLSVFGLSSLESRILKF